MEPPIWPLQSAADHFCRWHLHHLASPRIVPPARWFTVAILFSES